MVAPTQTQRSVPAAASREQAWPPLPLAGWRDTCVALHLTTQIVGKVRLALTPKLNQWWNVPLYLTARGLTTSPMPYGDRTVAVDLDFIDHRVRIADSDGRERSVALAPRPVAAFYRDFFDALAALDVKVAIKTHPVECPAVVPLDEDNEPRAYDADAAHRFWQALRAVEPVFERFRAGFRGKCSPVHFFWGSFDLAVTRFSGRKAPPRQGSIIERDAYDEECLSLGFWPGDAWGAIAEGPTVDASFYAYGAPEPPGYDGEKAQPSAARYDRRLREFVLPYETVRTSADPAAAILAFAESTYASGARLAGWDTRALAYP